MNLVNYLKRTKLQTRKDLVEFLNNFDCKITSWNGPFQELMDISRTSREYLSEYDNITVEPVNFRSIKRPNVWNEIGKSSILSNFDKMSINTQRLFLKEISEMFSE